MHVITTFQQNLRAVIVLWQVSAYLCVTYPSLPDEFLADIQLIQPAVVTEMGGSAAVLDWGTFWPPALGHVCELTTWSLLCVYV